MLAQHGVGRATQRAPKPRIMPRKPSQPPRDRFGHAWEIVSAGYCRGAFARDVSGKECMPEIVDAVAWGASGALYVIYDEVDSYARACSALREGIEQATGEDESIDDWSDRVGQGAVVELLKELDL